MMQTAYLSMASVYGLLLQRIMEELISRQWQWAIDAKLCERHIDSQLLPIKFDVKYERVATRGRVGC